MDQEPIRFESTGVAVDRRGRRGKLAAVVLVLSPGAFAALWMTGLALLAIFVALPISLASAAVLLRLRFDPATSAHPLARRSGEISLHDGALVVEAQGRTRVYPAGSITGGWVEHLATGVTVCLRTREGDLISADAPHVEGARRLLAAAGVSAEQQVLRMRLVNATTQVMGGGCLSILAAAVLTVVGVLALIVVIAGQGDPRAAAWLAGDVLLFLLLIRALTPAQVVIGADGLTIERVVTRRFIPFGSITDVTSEAGAVVVVASGKKIRLPTGERYFGGRGREQLSTQSALHARLEEARAAGKLGSSAQANAGDLERGGRPFAEWRERMRKLTTSEALYRRRAVSHDALALVLEDAAAPAERRLAAALALSAVTEPHVARRVREVVATCADERLRVALEAAAEGELTEEGVEAATRAEAKRV